MQDEEREAERRDRNRERASRWSRELAGADADEVLAWTWETFGDKAALFTSFQVGGMAIIDLAAEKELPFPIATLDTGRLPESTYEHWDRVRRRYGIQIRAILPDAQAVAKLLREQGPHSFRIDPDFRLECCRIRKVEPFRRAVSGHQAWLTGLRRDESSQRSDLRVVELDLANRPEGDLFKISPLVDWSFEDVWSYSRDRDVPIHPLYEEGYLSIGCEPCSRPARPTESPRDIRWWWESEGHRGLHLSSRRSA